MPTEVKVIIEDNALPIVQQALADRNAFLKNSTLPEINLEQFVQFSVEERFGISRESLAFRAIEEKKASIMSQISDARIETLVAVEAAVAEVIAKSP